MSEKKYKVGYTTGVYDMFHIGHLNILKKAKERCDYLIVGVSTDEVVESYKHRAPIIPFEERIAIIRELRCANFAAWTRLSLRCQWIRWRHGKNTISTLSFTVLTGRVPTCTTI